MKKNIIFTLGINNYDKLPTLDALKKYALKCDADLFIQTNQVIKHVNFYFEKFYFVELLESYERVLYVDADVLVTPNSQNIFELYNDDNYFYAYHENDNTSTMDRDEFIRPIIQYVKNWPTESNGKKTYFNAGVFLVSQKQKSFFKNFRDVPNIEGILSFGDQTYLNYLVFKNEIPFKSLDYSFNRMHLGNKDNENLRYKSNFIHYAGPDVYGDGNKLKTINNDYNNLYGN